MSAANGQPSTVFATLQVPYNPDYPVFYSNSSNDEQPGNFTVSFKTHVTRARLSLS